MKHKNFFLLLLAVLVSGCATAYGPSGFGGGYTDTMLQADVFKVSFRGNGFTDAERVSDFALLRAAELTINHGFNYFIIVDNKEATSTAYAAMPSQSYTTGNYNAYSGQYSANTRYMGGGAVPIHKASTSMMVKCFVEKPSLGVIPFDARELSRSIKGKYNIPAYTKAELQETPKERPVKKINLKDGTIIRGDITGMGGGIIRVTTPGGILNIPANEIEKIE